MADNPRPALPAFSLETAVQTKERAELVPNIEPAVTPSKLMHAAQLAVVGAPLHVVTFPRPEPGTAKALVRIMVSSSNPLDAKFQASTGPHARHAPSAVLGLDMAGIVERVGAGTLRELHSVIQVAMGWEGIHRYQFCLHAARYSF